MAERESYQQVQEHLTCPICLEQYRQPKQLRCHHSFCKECLERMPVEEDRNRCHTLRCPTCREVTPLTDKGISALPSSFLLVNLLEIFKRTHEITVTSAENEEQWICTEHKKSLDIYCNDCQAVICHHCSLRKHRNHSYDLVADIWDREMSEIIGKLIPLQEQTHHVEVARKDLHKFDTQLVESHEAVKLLINQEADDLIAAIQQSRHQLIEKATKITQRKRRVVSLQMEKVSDVLAHLNDYKCSVEYLLGHGSQLKVLASKAEIIQQLVSALDSFDLQALEPSEVNDLVFHPTSDEEPFEGLGSLTSTHLSDKCCVTGEGTRVAYLNKLASFQVSLAKEESPSNPILHSLICCQAMANGVKVECTVSQSCLHTYQVSYTPKVRVPLCLTVQVGGEEVEGSPFGVQVIPSLELNYVMTNLKKPQGIAASQLGEIAVAEKGKDCVTLFDKKGVEFARCRVYHPIDVTFSPDNHVLVTSEACKVYKYSRSGTLIGEVGSGVKLTNAPQPLVFHLPSGIAVSNSNKIYVAESSSHSVQVISSDLTYSKHITGFGGDDVAFDSVGNVLVADCAKGCINKLSPSNEVQKSFGSLSAPISIAVDTHDFVYVAEKRKHRIAIFDPNGQYLTYFGTKGSGPGQFNSPSGIATDQDGNVYVSDTGNNRVVVFQ